MTNIAREILFETASPVQNATVILSVNQKEVLDLFSAYDRARSLDDKQKIAGQICASLNINMQIEEEVFYPAVKKVLKEKGVISAAIMENAVVKYLINEIEGLDADSTVFDIKIRVLGEHVKNQIIERQTKLFPKINSFGTLDVWGLGAQLMARKEKLLEFAAR